MRVDSPDFEIHVALVLVILENRKLGEIICKVVVNRFEAVLLSPALVSRGKP